MTGQINPVPALVPAYVMQAIDALARAYECAAGDAPMQAAIGALYEDANGIALQFLERGCP